jgi:transketolase
MRQPESPTRDERVMRCRDMALALRRWIIEQSLASNVGHVGSALSIVDIMAALWEGTMKHSETAAADRDRFVLSKGHAALALYAALRWKRIIDESTFRTFCGDGSMLGVHPEHALPGVDVSTGSLGQGLSVACGLAYGFRLRRRAPRVFVIVSDAECNEGQIWEAAFFAAHHRLSNLCVVVDLNGLQALGRTRDIIAMPNMAGLWQAAGWVTVETDGHDLKGLLDALNPPEPLGGPTVVVARTVLGKGVSFMEDRLEWHYRNLTPAMAEQALLELEVLQ